MPEQQLPSRVTPFLGVQLQEVSMQIHARVKVCTHTIARIGPQEQPCGPHAQGFTIPCNDNPSDRTLASLPTPWIVESFRQNCFDICRLR